MSKTVFMTERQLEFEKLQQFINEEYIVRNNVILGIPEIRKKNSDYSEFESITKRTVASITLDAIKAGIEVKKSDVQLILDSSYASDYNPVEDYLQNTGTWDGHDYIGDFADRIKTNNPHFKPFFHKWFVGMVATWKNIDRMHGNSLMPVLIGTQGCGKSTICRMILPPELRYAYAERMPLCGGPEMERSMGRFLLVNLDEFDQLNARRQAILKNVIQSPQGKVRKLYTNNIVDVRRYASFIGTTNQLDVLADPTGSRRFICTEVEGLIDTFKPVNYKQMYAQAVEDLRTGYCYWLTKEDEKILEHENAKYRQVTPLMQLFTTYYRKATNDDSDVQWVTPLEIITSINNATRSHIELSKSITLGRELHGAGFESRRLGRGVVYRVVPLTAEEVA